MSGCTNSTDVGQRRTERGKGRFHVAVVEWSGRSFLVVQAVRERLVMRDEYGYARWSGCNAARGANLATAAVVVTPLPCGPVRCTFNTARCSSWHVLRPVRSGPPCAPGHRAPISWWFGASSRKLITCSLSSLVAASVVFGQFPLHEVASFGCAGAWVVLFVAITANAQPSSRRLGGQLSRVQTIAMPSRMLNHPETRKGVAHAPPSCQLLVQHVDAAPGCRPSYKFASRPGKRTPYKSPYPTYLLERGPASRRR